MRNAILTTFAGVLAASGCMVPFEYEGSDTIDITLGEIGTDCDSNEVLETDNGTLTSTAAITDQSEFGFDSACRVTAFWHGGTVFDMHEMRSEVAIQLRSVGLNPGAVDLTFTDAAFEISGLSIVAADGSTLVTDNGYAGDLEGMLGALDISMAGYGPDLMGVEIVDDQESFLAYFDTAYGEGDLVVDTLTQAYASGGNLLTEGDAVFEIEAERLDELDVLSGARVQLRYRVNVGGVGKVRLL